MARRSLSHPSDRGRPWRALRQLLAQPALVLIMLLLGAALVFVLARLLIDAGWMPAALLPGPGVWR